MTRIAIHAPDGGIVGHALCEEPTGDVTDRERDVDCGDCLDALDAADEALRRRLRGRGFQFDPPPRPSAAARVPAGQAAAREPRAAVRADPGPL